MCRTYGAGGIVFFGLPVLTDWLTFATPPALNVGGKSGWSKCQVLQFEAFG